MLGNNYYMLTKTFQELYYIFANFGFIFCSLINKLKYLMLCFHVLIIPHQIRRIIILVETSNKYLMQWQQKSIFTKNQLICRRILQKCFPGDNVVLSKINQLSDANVGMTNKDEYPKKRTADVIYVTFMWNWFLHYFDL